MSTENKSIIIVREPKMALPEKYIRSAVATYTSCGGYAIQAMKDAAPMIISDRMDTGASLDAVQELIKAYDDHRILLTFSKLDKVQEKVLQPFDLTMDGRNDVLMSMALEGEFPTLVEAGTTEEANFATRFILPSMQKFLKYSGGDLTKFLEELRDPTFVDSLMARVGERGQFVFFPPVGDAIWLGKNKLGSTFPWGQVSNTLGYKEEAPTKSDVKTEKPENGWFNYKKGPSVPVAETPVETKPAEPAPPAPLNLPGNDADTKITPPPANPGDQPVQDTTTPPAGHWETIPNTMNFKDRKKLIRRLTNCGNDLPEGWDTPGFKVWVVDYPKSQQTKKNEELRDHFKQGQSSAPKDMRDPNGPRPVAPTKGSEVVTEANLMVLTKDEKDRAETAIIKIMDRQGKEIPNPLDIQKSEQKYPDFYKEFGLSYERTDGYLPSDIASFAMENGKAFFHMFLATRRRAITAEAALAAAKNTPVQAEPGAVNTEVVNDPPKKTGTGGWGNWGK